MHILSVPKALVPPEVDLVRSVSSLLLSLAVSSEVNSRCFIDSMLLEQAQGLRLLIQLLDSPGLDAAISAAVNTTLFAMISNPSAMGAILKTVAADKTVNVTTLRWLITSIATLTSDRDSLDDVYVTEESPHPVEPGMAYTREVMCPLASRLIIKFDSQSEFDYGELGISSEDSTIKFNKENYPTGPVEINSSYFTLTYSTKGFSKWGYRMDVKAVYDLSFDANSSIQVVLQNDGVKVLSMAVKSKDNMTQLMASRALANLACMPPASIAQVNLDNTSAVCTEQVIGECLHRLVVLMDAKNAVPAAFTTINSKKTAIMISLRSSIRHDMVKQPYYFEVTLQGEGDVLVGLFSECHYVDVNSASIPQGCVLLDNAASAIRWGSRKRSVTLSSWFEGDTIGIFCDPAARQIGFSLNGEPISEPFSIDKKNTDNLWTSGFYPFALLQSHSGLYWNFGQESFLYIQPVNSKSVLEVTAGPMPTLDFQKNRWQNIAWSVYDAAHKQGRDYNHERDMLMLAEIEVTIRNRFLEYNHRRQIARGLYGASRHHIQDTVLMHAKTLCKSTDMSTKRWAVLVFMRVLDAANAGEYDIQNVRNMISDDILVLTGMVEVCDAGLIDSKRIIDTLFVKYKIGFDFLREYLNKCHKTTEMQAVMYESSHPYTNNTDEVKEIVIPNATHIEIFFHPDTRTEATYDHVTFYSKHPQEADDPEAYCLGRYSGPFSAFPSDENPLLVSQNRVWCRFVSDYSNFEWGWKFIARAFKPHTRDITCVGPAKSIVWSAYSEISLEAGAFVVEYPAHPYGPDAVDWKIEVSVSGADSVKIAFDPLTSTHCNDVVSIWRDEALSEGFDGLTFSGGLEHTKKTFPGIHSHPAIIPSGNFWVAFKALGQSVDWGFRMAVCPVAPPDPWKDLLANSHILTFESEHDYALNIDISIPISIPFPDSEAVSIVFDPQTVTVADYDFVVFHKDETLTSHWGSPSYSGSYDNWPSVHNPLVIPSKDFVLRFKTGSSNKCWGYKFYVVPWQLHHPLRIWAGNDGDVIEYSHSMDVTRNFLVDMSGVAAVEIAFDDSCQLTQSSIEFVHADERTLKLPGTERYGTRDSHKVLPTMEHPLLVGADKFVIAFTKDSSASSSEFKVACRPVFELNESQLTILAKRAQFNRPEFDVVHDIMESAASYLMLSTFLLRAAYYATRPAEFDGPLFRRRVDCSRNKRGFYASCRNVTGCITFPGALEMSVVFDEKCISEKDVDILQFYSDCECSRLGQLAGKTFSGKYSEEWNFNIENCQRISYRFRSDATRNAWGFRFVVSSMASGSRDFTGLKQMVSGEIFNVILKYAVDGPDSLCEWAGLLLVNALCDNDVRHFIISYHGCQWIKDLLASKIPNVTLAALLCLFDNDTSDPKNLTAWSMKRQYLSIITPEFAPSFISLLLSQNEEIRYASMLVLKATCHIKSNSATGVLVECLLIDDALARWKVLREMSRVDADSLHVDEYIDNGAIKHIKDFILRASVSSDIAVELVKALTRLVKYHECVTELLLDDENGADLVNRCLNMVPVSEGLKLLLQLTKVLLPRFEICSVLDDKVAVDMRYVFGIGKSCRPVWFAADNSRGDETAQRSTTCVDTVIGSISLWLYPVAISGNDGLTILYKGKSQCKLINSHKSTQTIRADILVQTGKVYYEIVYDTISDILCGWANVDAPVGNTVFGHDESAFGINLSSSCTNPALIWSGFTENPTFENVSKCSCGDVLGVALDFDSGVMNFYINGVLIRDMSFLASRHSSLTTIDSNGNGAGNIKETVNGYDWSKGFYPTVVLGIDERCTVNVGQEPFRYKPDNFTSVIEKGAGDTPSPIFCRMQRARTKSDVWTPVGTDMFFEGDADAECNFLTLSLNASLRLQLQLGILRDGKKIVLPVCSVGMIAMNRWTHCLVSICSKTITFFINGQESSVHNLGHSTVLSNSYDICVGASMRRPFTPDPCGKLFVSHLVFSFQASLPNAVYEKPTHFQCVQKLNQTLSPNYVVQIVNAIMSNESSQVVNALCVLSRMWQLSVEDGRILTLIGEDKISKIVKKCLDGVIAEDDGLDSVVVIKVLAALSCSKIGKFTLVRMDVMRLLLAMATTETHFWIEVVLGNMCLSEQDADELAAKLSVSKEDLYYFGAPVHPFSSRHDDQLMWKDAPVAIFMMAQHPPTFVKIARSIGTPVYHGFLDDATPLPMKYDENFAKWCVDCYSILTRTPSQGGESFDRRTVIIETKTHPYQSNEDYGDTVIIPDAVALKCTFDPRSKCEGGLDYLQIWRAADKKERIPGPAADGKFSGTSMEMWPSFEISGNSFYYEWHSDYSVEEWGFLLEVTPICFYIPNADIVREQIVNSGGIVPLVDFMAHSKNPYLRRGAKRALSQLTSIEKVRGMVDNGDGLESLLKMVSLLRYQVIVPEGVVGSSHSTPSDADPKVVVPEGTEILVNRKRWFTADGVPDDFHNITNGGYYRLRIEDPEEYRGHWIAETLGSSVQVKKKEVDKESLRLLGLLSQSPKSRARLIDVGKMETLFKLTQLDDPECHLTVAMALSDVAGSQYDWLKLCAADEVRLYLNKQENAAYFYSQHRCEFNPVRSFANELPSYTEISQDSVGLKVHCDGVIGEITAFRDHLVHILWEKTLPNGEQESIRIPQDVSVVYDSKGNILGYPASECEVLIDTGSRLCNSVEVQIFAEPEMQKVLTRFLSENTEMEKGVDKIWAAGKGSTAANEGSPVVLPSRTAFLKMFGDISALPDSAEFRMHMLPHYNSRSPLRVSYEEQAFAFLDRAVDMAEGNAFNDDIRAHATIALGKLIAPVEIPSAVGPTCFRASQYRDRFIKGQAFHCLLKALHSNNTKLMKPSGQALMKLFPDMTQLMEILPMLRKLPIVESPLLTSFLAFVIFRLTRSRFRPMFYHYRGSWHPATFNTKIESNFRASTIAMPYAVMNEDCSYDFEIEFPGATSISVLLHPNSALNCHSQTGGGKESGRRDGPEKDVLLIFADKLRTQLLHTINASRIAELSENGDILFEDNRSSLYLSFLSETITTDEDLKKHSNSGFGLIAYAAYSPFDYVGSVGTPYHRGSHIVENEARQVQKGCIIFMFCNFIEIEFSKSLCHTAAVGDVLQFYRHESCSPQHLEKSFSGPSSSWNDFSFEGTVLYYTFTVESEGECSGGFHFHARPKYEYVPEFRVTSNVHTFLGLDSAERVTGDHGLKFLTPLLDSKDHLTRKWAAVAYGQLATFNGKMVDPFSDKFPSRAKQKVDEKSTVEKDSGGHGQLLPFSNRYRNVPHATERLLSNYGVDFASKMLDDDDPTIRGQGCLAMSYFMLNKDGRTQIYSDGIWRNLVTVCMRTLNNSNSLDMNSCRSSCWMLAELTKEQHGVLPEIAATSFGSLTECLSSSDRMVRSFAASATFSLASHPANRELLLKNGIALFVKIVTHQPTTIVSSSKMSQADMEKESLRQGALMAVIGLIESSESAEDVLQVLEHDTVDVLLISVQTVHQAILSFDTSENESLTALPPAVLQLTPLLVGALARFRKWKHELLPVISQTISTWTAVVETICNMLSRMPRNEQLIYLLKSHRMALVDVLIAVLDVNAQSLRVIVLRSLITISACWWSDVGYYVFENIIEAVQRDNQWVSTIIKNKIWFNEYVVSPCLGIFTTDNLRNPFDDDTNIVLDFFNCLCSINGVPDRENQEVVLAAVQHTKRGNVYVSPCQFDFRLRDQYTDCANLELSCTASPSDRAWRKLSDFYQYELRQSTKNFMNSTFALWAALCSGNCDVAISHFKSFLTFEQLFDCMMWQYTESNYKLKSQAYIFVNLMTHLFVDVDPADNFCDSHSHLCRREIILDKLTGAWQRVSYTRLHVLTQQQRDVLIFYANIFLRGGRITSVVCVLQSPQYANKIKQNHITLVDAMKGNYLETAFAEAVLGMVKCMVNYGYYSSFGNDLEMLEVVVIEALNLTCTYAVSSPLVRIKRLMLDILESINRCRTELYIDEYTDLILKLYDPQPADESPSAEGVRAMVTEVYRLVVENSSPVRADVGVTVCDSENREGVVVYVSDADPHLSVMWWPREGGNVISSNVSEVLKNGVTGIRYPRLKHLFKRQMSKADSFEVHYAMVMRQLGSLDDADTLDLVRSAVQVLMTYNNGIHEFMQKVNHLTIMSRNEKSGFAKLHQLCTAIDGVFLRSNMGPIKVMEIEYLLQSLSHALEGRTVCAEVAIGSRVISVADNSSGEVIEVHSHPNGREVVVKWVDSSSSIHDFGKNEKFDVILAVPGSCFVPQSYARMFGVHNSLSKLLRCKAILSSECTSILKLCYSVLTAFLRDNEENQKVVFRNADYMRTIISHFHMNCDARQALSLTLSCSVLLEELSYVVVNDLTACIQEHFHESHFALDVLQILCKMIPKEDDIDAIYRLSSETMDGRRVKALRTAQSIILLTLAKNVGRVQDFFRSPGELQNLNDFDMHILDVLSLCTYRNDTLRIKISESCGGIGKISEALLAVFCTVKANSYGFRSRIRQMAPWARFISIWFNMLTVSVNGNNIVTANMRDYPLVLESSVVNMLKSEYSQYLSAHNKAITMARNISLDQFQGVCAESSHPYASSCDYWVEVEVPKASRVKIAFSSLSVTERGCDFVKILKCPPMTNEGWEVYNTICELTSTSSLHLASAKRHTIPCNVTVKIHASSKSQLGRGDDCVCRGMIVQPEEFANTWITLSPKTVYFCDEKGHLWNKTWSPVKFSGEKWPSVNNPLIIHDRKFIVYFHSDNSNEMWGWKLSAKGMTIDEFPDQLDPPEDQYLLYSHMPEGRVYESAHEYSCNLDLYETVEFPGAQGIIIVFDSETVTEKTYDYIQFFKDSGHSEHWGQEKYSGDINSMAWPGVNGNEPLYIPANTFVLHFHTDFSNVAWGYRFVAVPGPPPSSAFEKKCNLDGACVSCALGLLNDDFTFKETVGPVTITHDGLETAHGVRLASCSLDDLHDALSLSYPGSVQLVESAHPYSSDASGTCVEISIAGASAVHIVFDERTRTRNGQDVLTFTDAKHCNDVYQFEVSLSGQSFRAHGVHSPLSVNASTFCALFQCDVDAENMWGYRFIVYDSALEHIVEKVLEDPCYIIPGQRVTPLKFDQDNNKAMIASGASVAYGAPDDANIESSLVPIWVHGMLLDLNPPHEDVFEVAPTNQSRVATNGVELTFRGDTMLGPRDKIEIYRPGEKSTTGSLVTTLTQQDNETLTRQPLGIRCDGALVVKYIRHSPYSPGLQMCGLLAKVNPDIFDSIIQLPNACGRYKIFESPHPYANNTSKELTVTFEGACRLVVAFDPKTSTERNYDFLLINGTKYHGGRGGSESNFPIFDPLKEPLLVLDGDTFRATFTSDGSNDDWGYRMIVFDAALLVVQKDESAHDQVGLESERRRASDVFGYFENRSSEVQTVKIHMPVVTCGYFEIVCSTASVKESFIQVGCVVDGSTVEILPTTDISAWPVCLGLGQWKGSYAIDGVADVYRHSTKWADGSPKSLVQDLTFKPGLVIGVLMDLRRQSISFFINDVDIGASISQGPTVSWARGLCPAFTFMPGQALFVNVGQHNMIYRKDYPTVLSSYLPLLDNGTVLCWDESWREWKMSEIGSQIYEDPTDESVKRYIHTLSNLFERLRIPAPRDSSALLVEDKVDFFQNETTFDASSESMLRHCLLVLPSIKSILYELSVLKLNKCNVSYPPGLHHHIQLIPALSPTPTMTENAELWLRPVNKEIDISLSHRLLDIGVVQTVQATYLDAIFLCLASSYSDTSPKTAKTLYPGADKVKPRTRSASMHSPRLTMVHTATIADQCSNNLTGIGIAAYLKAENDKQRSKLLSNLVTSVFSADNSTSRWHETALVVARLLRTLVRTIHQNEFESPDENIVSNFSPSYKQHISSIDTFVTPSELYTLRRIQECLFKIGAVDFSCYLLSQVDDTRLQVEGVELGIFLTLVANESVRSEFSDRFSATASGGSGYMDAIAETLSHFERGKEQCGQSKLDFLHNTTRLLVFLENLCDGQNSVAQCKMANAFSKSGDNIVSLVVHNLGIVVADLSTIGKYAVGGNPTELLYQLRLTDQSLDTLIDFVQGPFMEVQTILMKSPLFQILHELFMAVIALQLVVFKEIDSDKDMLLPTLKDCVDLHRSWRSLLTSRPLQRAARRIEKHILGEIIQVLTDVECHVLELLSNMLESDSNETSHEASMSSISRLRALLDNIEMPALIERFKVCWASVVFEPYKHLPLLDKQHLWSNEVSVTSADPQQNRGSREALLSTVSRGYETLQSLRHKPQGLFSLIHNDRDSVFQPENIMTELSWEDKMLFYRMWSLRSEDNVERAINLAHYYYSIFTITCDHLSNEVFMDNCGDSMKAELKNIEALWNPDSATSRVSEEELRGFDSYFASIEIVTGKSQLRRLYFVIPR